MIEYEGSRDEFLKLLADFDEAPAFVARARAPQAALDSLLSECEIKREEMLKWPRLHWAGLANRVSRDWGRLASYLESSDARDMLAKLDVCLRSDSKVPYDFLLSEKAALRRFLESAERFNQKWHRYVTRLDLESVNQTRRDYNEYYVVEKACALGSDALVRGFVPLGMIDHAFLLDRFPMLDYPV